MDKTDERLKEIGIELSKTIIEMTKTLSIRSHDDQLKLAVVLLDYSSGVYKELKGIENTAEMLYFMADTFADKVVKPKWEPNNG